MLTPPLPHVCFFHFSDTCSLGSNGSTKFLEPVLSLIPFQRADPALVLECYVSEVMCGGIFFVESEEEMMKTHSCLKIFQSFNYFVELFKV
jgi:hypothetical protein